MNIKNLKEILDIQIIKRNTKEELSLEKPDPLLVATKYKDEYISLICALFAYGNAHLIVKFLSSLDYSLLNKNEDIIRKTLNNRYYRFQSSQDVSEFFITMKRLREIDSVENIFYEGYKKENLIIDGILHTIKKIYQTNSYNSKGYSFLIGNLPKKIITSPYKRWNMYLRWMVRKDNLDLGLWNKVNKKELLIPLDTHTFNVSNRLGLINKKTYDYKAVLLLTQKLREFDIDDPIKYDFALYRIGQEKIAFY